MVRSFVCQLRVLLLDSDAAEETARIMGSLLRIGQPVNALDVLIAGTALSNGAEKIISTDRDHVRIARVSDLTVEIMIHPGWQEVRCDERGLKKIAKEGWLCPSSRASPSDIEVYLSVH